MSCLEAWYVPIFPTGVDWRDRCAKAVDLALSGASLLPETHVASATVALSDGRTRDALLARRHALELAPTCVHALEALGSLECQAGRTLHGTERLRLAAGLDPESATARVLLARDAAFSGNTAEAERQLAALGDAILIPHAFLMQMRIAAWTGDDAALRSLLSRSRGVSDASRRVFYMEVIGRALLGDAPRDEIEGHLQRLLPMPKDPRLHANVLVNGTEIALRTDRQADALAHLRRLSALELFIDLDWLERCPLMASIRGRPNTTRLFGPPPFTRRCSRGERSAGSVDRIDRAVLTPAV